MRAPFVKKKYRKNKKQRAQSSSSTRSGAGGSQRSNAPKSGSSNSVGGGRGRGGGGGAVSPHRSPVASPGNSPHSETVPLVEVKISPPPLSASPAGGRDASAPYSHGAEEAEITDRTPLHV